MKRTKYIIVRNILCYTYVAAYMKDWEKHKIGRFYIEY